jgi:hypothetical protein
LSGSYPVASLSSWEIVFYLLAAGNKGTGLCGSSPARTGAGTNNSIATVAAIDRLDRETSWSTYGKYVDFGCQGRLIPRSGADKELWLRILFGLAIFCVLMTIAYLLGLLS